MSVENFKKFGQLCAEDKVVRAKAKEIGMEDLDGLIAYGKELGLTFSIKDIKQLADDAGLVEEELNEDQLEQVAGGIVTTTAAVVVGASASVIAAGAQVTQATSAKGW